ncbi:ArsR/SmtB family transcription factor [Dactylosporangium sp. CA-152071]|uniref:ArsR/SmtB family transcription factor n=1 Tax=Dactylosporangium sp. CA-152071 TaxID=3239933 RepID=UPI003D94C95E
MDVFAAVANPTRRGILEMLRESEHASGDFVAAFPGITQPAISRHLRLLRKAGLVDVRTDAQRRMYTLQPEPLAEIDAWLGLYRHCRRHHHDTISDSV